MNDRPPRVSVIIVNYNAGEKLLRCLACLDAQSFRDFETIIVDNASGDGSASRAKAQHPDARLIQSGSNIGFAAANNLAARDARGEWLAFLNPDAYAQADWLEELVAASARYPFADAFGSTQIDALRTDRIDGAGDVYHILGVAYRGGYGSPVSKLPEDGECFAPCAAAAMYRRKVFEALGGFDERFFCYGEDVDLGFRLRLAGGRAVQVRAAVVRHEGSGVTGRYSDFTVYHGNRNRIWLAYKNTPALFYWPLFPIRIAFDAYLFVRSFTLGAQGAYIRAVRDGYGGLVRFRADRARLQSSRRMTNAEFARAATWSPLSMLLRRTNLRPLPAKG